QVRVAENDDELVAGQPGGKIAAPHVRAQQAGERLQHAVSDRVRMAVVDLLEAIDVDQRDRRTAAPGAVRLERLGQCQLEMPSVRQRGERILERPLLESPGFGLELAQLLRAPAQLEVALRDPVVMLEAVA